MDGTRVVGTRVVGNIFLGHVTSAGLKRLTDCAEMHKRLVTPCECSSLSFCLHTTSYEEQKPRACVRTFQNL